MTEKMESKSLENKSIKNFKLPNELGAEVSLSEFKGKKVILYFYPKDDTPGCTKESCDFRDSFARLKRKNVVVLGVSKDSVKSHLKFKTKYDLPFSLLSDEEGVVLNQFGVWKEKSMYGKTYMGIERSTFLLEVNDLGKAKCLKAFLKVKVEGHVDEILETL